MADPQPEVRDIFCAALDRENPQHRAEYLDQACQGNPELRARIEALLRAHDEASGFLQDPSGGVNTTIDQPAAEAVGTVIGSYKLIEQIGEGGMGTVWMAQQTEPVKRLVALKLIKAGMDSKQVIARFEAERQALALMDHPNIAKVFDGGAAPSGRPYFVMELVKGVPITDFCDQNHLTPRQRLELFLSVCQAVQHAHQKGIIHRDLKPSNVLVSRHDTTPVVKVIDFGVAKALGQELTDKTLFTGVAQMLGTPLYMSPEQAGMSDLDVDTRSDIYSLGVLLYELLAGTTPFDKERFKRAGYDEIRRIIREEEPPRPSTRLSTLGEDAATVSANRESDPRTLSRLLRGELDWVVMKALEKDRNRRYETANGFAMDVQRYLADEPVLACPPSVGYRLRKFVRRNKARLAVAGLVLLTLLTLTGGIGWNVRDRAARHDRVAAQVDLLLSEVERLEREQKWPEALAAARRGEAIVACGETDAVTAQRVHERLRDLEFIRRLDEIRLQRSTWVAGNYSNAGADRDFAQAFREYGVDIDEMPVELAVARLNARATLRLPLAVALDEWFSARSFAKANGDPKRLVAVARGLDPEPVRDRLRAYWLKEVAFVPEEFRRWVDSIDLRAQHPIEIANLAVGLKQINDRNRAVKLLRDALQIYPSDFWLNYTLANSLSDKKQYLSAVRFYTAAVALRPQATAALNNLGTALQQLKRLDEALACYRKAVEIDPTHAIAHANIGLVLALQGQPDLAIASSRKAIELDPKFASPHNIQGMALSALGRSADAIASYERAIAIDPTYKHAHSNLGHALTRLGRLDEAIASYRKALALDPTFAPAHCGLGGALSRQSKLDEAIASYREAIKHDPEYRPARDNLGWALGAWAWRLINEPSPTARDPKRALEGAVEAVKVAPESAITFQYLGWVQYRLGNWQASIEALEKSCKLQERGTGDCGQWIVMALVHAKLAAQEGLTDKEREHHKMEARRRYEEATKQIDQWWRDRPAHKVGQAIWAFREEARKLTELTGPEK